MAGRGIDFEHKFKTSRWAEDLLLQSLRKEAGIVAVRFGLSQVKADRDVKYDKKTWKEPDLLVYKIADLTEAEQKILDVTDCVVAARDKFKPGGELNFVIAKACAAVEVEFSPYRASEMKGRGWKTKTAEQWLRRPLKHAKPPSAPNIWIKGEDLSRLNGWKTEFGVPIVVVHLFDQEGFAVKLEAVNEFYNKFNVVGCDKLGLQITTGIFYQSDYSYDRVDAQGAGEKKPVFNVSPAVAVKVGDVKNVKVESQLGLSASKKYVTHSIFSGGHITFSAEFLSMLKNMRDYLDYIQGCIFPRSRSGNGFQFRFLGFAKGNNLANVSPQSFRQTRHLRIVGVALKTFRVVRVLSSSIREAALSLLVRARFSVIVPDLCEHYG